MSTFNVLSAALVVLILAACLVLVTGLRAANADLALSEPGPVLAIEE